MRAELIWMLSFFENLQSFRGPAGRIRIDTKYGVTYLTLHRRLWKIWAPSKHEVGILVLSNRPAFDYDGSPKSGMVQFWGV